MTSGLEMEQIYFGCASEPTELASYKLVLLLLLLYDRKQRK